MLNLHPQPLTPEAFAPFGEVIDTHDRDYFMINNGSTRRYHKLASVELGKKDDQAIISIFRAQALSMPLRINMLERHPLGSQAFIPMKGKPFLIVVAPPGDIPHPQSIQAFISDGSQGINYGLGVWHHPVLCLEPEDDFLVVDRSGDGDNCDEYFFSEQTHIVLNPSK